MKTPLHLRALLAPLLTVALTLPAQAATLEWSGDSSTNFATAGNWVGGTAPLSNVNDDIAAFYAETYTRQPALTNNRSINGLIFGNGSTASGSVTLGLGGNNFNIGSSGIVMNEFAGAVNITGDSSLRLRAWGDQTWVNNSANNLTISTGWGAASSGSPSTITLAGTGNFIFNGQLREPNTTNAVSVTVNLSGEGRADFNAAPAATIPSGTITLEAGTLRIGEDNPFGTGPVVLNGGTFSSVNSSSRVLTNALTIGGNVTFGGAGDLTFSNVNLGAAVRTLTVTNNTTTFAGAVTNTGGIVKTGTGTLNLSGVNTYTGSTSVQQGGLVVSSGGSLASSNTTISNAGSSLIVNGTISGLVTATHGGLVAGSGTVGTLNICGAGVLDPGNSAGTTTATNGAAWAQGGTYNWEIFSLADHPGTSWDLLDVTAGTLDLTGITGAGGFTINLITLQTNNATQGALDGFVPTATYTNWLIARAQTIDGFNANLFNLDSSLFVGATGTFAIEQRTVMGGQGLFLTYNVGGEPIPEPGTWAAALLLTGLAAYVRRRTASGAKRARKKGSGL